MVTRINERNLISFNNFYRAKNLKTGEIKLFDNHNALLKFLRENEDYMEKKAKIRLLKE